MCISFPGKITEIVDVEAGRVKVDLGGGMVKELLSLIDDPKVGERVTVYAGTVMERVSEEEYYNTVNAWSEMAKLLEEQGEGAPAMLHKEP